ncbi:hypothetical protein BH10ACI1_BH10ACI1_07400 [soil metagenome]
MKRVKLIIIAVLLIVSLMAACYENIDDENRKSSTKTPYPTATLSATNDNSAVNNSNNSTTNVNNVENNSTNMTSNNSSTEVKSGGFNGNLPAGFVQPTDSAGKRFLREYGAMLVARGGATPPTTVIFRDEAAVSTYQSGLSKLSESVSGVTIELQSAAMKNLKEAVAEAKQSNLTITPNGADAAKRDYAGTVKLWNSRVEPGLKHWVSKGKITQADANRIKALSTYEQIPEILKLEEKQIWFAMTLDKTILQSVAAPGTSQHISMLALDIKENGNAKVREILAKHGWFQTVKTDLPHFTFLGVKESELPALGLKKVSDGGRTYWLPDI